jgi:hypothetical protein
VIAGGVNRRYTPIHADWREYGLELNKWDLPSAVKRITSPVHPRLINSQAGIAMLSKSKC